MRWKSILVSLLIIAGVFAWMSNGNIGNEAVRKAATQKEIAQNQDNETTEELFLVTIRSSLAQSFARQIQINGRTNAPRYSAIKAEVHSSIAEILVKDGDRVNKGDVLVKLSKETFPAAYASAQAGLKSAAKNYSAIKNLSDDGFQSELQVLQANEALIRAKQAVSLAKKALDDTTIVAPYSGVIEDLRVELGDIISSGAEVARIIDLDPIEVIAFVSERELNDIRIGQKASITLINGEISTGTVDFIAPSSDIKTGTFEIRIRLSNPDMRLRAGISSDVVIFSNEIPAHFQSKSLLTLNNQGRVGVKGVDAQNRVVFYPVEIIEDTRNGIYLGGLPKNVRLIVAGQDFVKSGNQVRTQNES